MGLLLKMGSSSDFSWSGVSGYLRVNFGVVPRAIRISLGHFKRVPGRFGSFIGHSVLRAFRRGSGLSQEISKTFLDDSGCSRGLRDASEGDSRKVLEGHRGVS